MSQILTPQQLEAASLLAYGDDFYSVYTQLKIDRKTLYNWRQLSEFQAEMRRIIQQRRGMLPDRLMLLAERSLNALETDLRTSANGKTALAVLKMLGESQFSLRCMPEAAPAENKQL